MASRHVFPHTRLFIMVPISYATINESRCFFHKTPFFFLNRNKLESQLCSCYAVLIRFYPVFSSGSTG